MSVPLLIIHVEDSSDDSELMAHLLREEGMECEVIRVETREQLEKALAARLPDLIVSDCTLPQFSGLEALEIARSVAPDVPFVFFSGTIGEEMAIESLQHGATDYVLKHRMARLVPAARRALDDARQRRVRAGIEAQLRQARKLEAIGTSVGGIAHDFRNLLQSLKLGIELLFLDADKPASVLEIATRLNHASERGQRMIEELMAFARKTETQLAPVDMAGVIRETAAALRGALTPAVRLELQLAEGMPDVPADSAQIDRILTNLIINARDAMPQGGCITITTDAVQFDSLPPGLWPINDAPYFRIRVADAGTGMDEPTQARIFEPFFTTKGMGKGTGLGLPVVYGLMEAHHGFIDLESAPGKGTTFSLFFPMARNAAVSERIRVVAPKHLIGEVAGKAESSEYEV